MKVAELTAGTGNTAGDTLAFEFNKNTYVYNLKGAAADVTADNIVELVGVTGITAVGTAAADNTIVIA